MNVQKGFYVCASIVEKWIKAEKKMVVETNQNWLFYRLFLHRVFYIDKDDDQ